MFSNCCSIDVTGGGSAVYHHHMGDDKRITSFSIQNNFSYPVVGSIESLETRDQNVNTID